MFYRLHLHPNGWCACLEDRILWDPGGMRIPPGSLAARFPPRTGDAEADWLAWCQAAEEHGVLADPDEEEPGTAAPWDYDLDAVIAECRQVTAEEAAAAARAARLGLPGGQSIPLARRGPGQPGSARLAPGEYLSRAAGFGAGMVLDTMPGCGALAGFAAEAAGDDDRYAGAGDDEVAGAIARGTGSRRTRRRASTRRWRSSSGGGPRRAAPPRVRLRCRPRGMSSP